MRRSSLRDDQWERIKDLLPGRNGHVGVTAKDNRLFVEAVLFRYRSGSAWRDLPARLGNFRMMHTRFSCWSKTGVWEQMFEQLAAHTNWCNLAQLMKRFSRICILAKVAML